MTIQAVCFSTCVHLKKIFFTFTNRQFSTATDEQLFDALERTQIENETLVHLPSITEIFRTWSNNPGYPILNVHFSPTEKVIKISQEQFVPFINATESSEFFILFNYVTSQRASADYWLPEKSEWHWIQNDTETASRELEIQLEEASPDWVIFNLQQTGEQSNEMLYS